MRTAPVRALLGIGVASAIALSATPRAAALPDALDDAEFWRLVTGLSEPGGTFTPQLMSNEDSAQVVIPGLQRTASRGSVYVGVGPEQNFTYLAALEPKLAFIVDIRRDNLLQHLIYKALFELSADRAGFLSRLFARPRPPDLDPESGARALFDAYREVEPDAALSDETLRAMLDRLTRVRGFELDDADRTGIARIMEAFRAAGPHALEGSGDKHLTYADAMAATDLDGVPHGYLASEAHFRVVQDLQRRNLVVPVVGDFAGDRALPGIGRFVGERGATIGVFYVSNVERYLFDRDGRHQRFYANVAALPLEPSSLFIRSVTRDISRRLSIPLPEADGDWWTMLASIPGCLEAVAAGRVDSYQALFAAGR